MTHVASIPKAARVTALALLLSSACGSFSADGDPMGSSGRGGSSSGASSISQAGKQLGGSASGGMAGTAHGGRPTAGAGGGSPGGEACNAPPVSGNCDAYFEVWFHDPSTGLCRPFIYGGCGGNENNYPSFEACQQACPAGSPNYDACDVPTDCVIAGDGCCGVCDTPGIGARNLLSYNKKYTGQVQQCALAAEGALPRDDDSGSLKYFVPNCVQGQCVVEDIRTSTVSACETDQDCFIRNGNGCCESCSPKRSIAISASGGFNQLVCGGLQPSCPACTVAPPNETAVCGQSGHCEIAPGIPR